MWILILMLALNFGISWVNCWSVGRVWQESKALGGWIRALTWCGAIQAAIGFSSVIGFLFGAVLHTAGYLPDRVAHGAVSLWYLLIIIPALSTGLMITIASWIAAYRDRSWANMGTAAYNTFAMAHNTYGAIDGISQAWAGVGKLFDTKDDEGGSQMVLFAVVLVLAALAGGFIFTYALIRHYAAYEPLDEPALA